MPPHGIDLGSARQAMLAAIDATRALLLTAASAAESSTFAGAPAYNVAHLEENMQELT